MSPFRLLPVAALLAFANAVVAAETPPREERSACARTMNDEGAGARDRAGDADIDGSGACALDDGKVKKQSRANGGSSVGNEGGAQDVAPGGHRFGVAGDAHELASRGRVVTVDVSGDTLRGAIDGTRYRTGTDLFGSELDYAPVPAYWTARPDYSTATGAGRDNGDLALTSVAEGSFQAAPGGAGGALTSRSGGSMLGDEGATSPTSPVPEPGTWAMLLAGAGVLLARRRFG